MYLGRAISAAGSRPHTAVRHCRQKAAGSQFPQGALIVTGNDFAKWLKAGLAAFARDFGIIRRELAAI
jgi:hypothetical protein